MSTKSVHILLLEPFFTGSHRSWALGLQAHSRHRVSLLSLPGRHWKWRMHGGAVHFARQFKALSEKPDLVLATSMLDVAVFRGLCQQDLGNIPVALYMHESQFTYPWSERDPDVSLKRDRHYAFINFTSALAADRVWFNSAYHQRVFLEALPTFLDAFPDYPEKASIQEIANKSDVLPLGLDLSKFDAHLTTASPRKGAKKNSATILWNHRWEHDKNPKAFFELLRKLKDEQVPFELIVLGKGYQEKPKAFHLAKAWFKKELLHWGYADDFKTYAQLLGQADLAPVTSYQDFFGGSVVEAIYCGAYPLLPNRLAYPEHLPEGRHSAHLYDHEAELFLKIKAFCQDFNGARQRETASFVSKYDWKNLILRYDQAIEDFLDCPA
ncbi:MAG: DUF3524 domain-containing protein [Bacteroidota bacterium]